MDLDRIAREAQAGAREVKSVRASLAIHHACQALFEIGDELRRSGFDNPVWIVIGRTQEDRSEDETEWVSAIRRHKDDATRLAQGLSQVAALAARKLGKEDLFGLSQSERVVMKDLIGGNDTRAQVGRHGVIWTVECRKVI